MSVLKGKQGLSELQFYINAIDLRKELTLLLLRDFGIKSKVRTVESYAKMKRMADADKEDFLRIVYKYNMNEEDAALMMELVEKYLMSPEDGQRFIDLVRAYKMDDMAIEEYPSWLIDRERTQLLNAAEHLHMNITMAYSIYPSIMSEYEERRLHQDKAIANCYQILQEMQFVISVMPVNAEKMMRYVDMINKEISLLKGWRKADNKLLKNIK